MSTNTDPCAARSERVPVAARHKVVRALTGNVTVAREDLLHVLHEARALGVASPCVITRTVTLTPDVLLDVLKQARAWGITSPQFRRLEDAATRAEQQEQRVAAVGQLMERVAIADVCPGDLVAETGAGPFLPVLLNVPGLLRLDGRQPGAEDALWLDHATGPGTTVVRLL